MLKERNSKSKGKADKVKAALTHTPVPFFHTSCIGADIYIYCIYIYIHVLTRP
jgi:predicted membrane chloride channel (bestrophin family)